MRAAAVALGWSVWTSAASVFLLCQTMSTWGAMGRYWSSMSSMYRLLSKLQVSVVPRDIRGGDADGHFNVNVLVDVHRCIDHDCNMVTVEFTLGGTLSRHVGCVTSPVWVCAGFRPTEDHRSPEKLSHLANEVVIVSSRALRRRQPPVKANPWPVSRQELVPRQGSLRGVGTPEQIVHEELDDPNSRQNPGRGHKSFGGRREWIGHLDPESATESSASLQAPRFKEAENRTGSPEDSTR